MTRHAIMKVQPGDRVYRVEWGLDGRTPKLTCGAAEPDPAAHPYCLSGLRVLLDCDPPNVAHLAAFERTEVEAWATAIAWAHRQRERLRNELGQWDRLYTDLVAAQD